jgi:hypothetical protein
MKGTVALLHAFGVLRGKALADFIVLNNELERIWMCLYIHSPYVVLNLSSAGTNLHYPPPRSIWQTPCTFLGFEVLTPVVTNTSIPTDVTRRLTSGNLLH